jgi:hypothetical protein
MTETQTPETTEYQRVFWPSDYRKAARLVRNMRHVRCEPWTPKDAASQAKADQMATAMAEVFAADCQGFSPAVFIDGSRLPEDETGTGNVLLDSPPASEDDESDTEGGLLP